MSIPQNKIKTRPPPAGPESLVATLSLRPLLVELQRRGQDAETLLQPFGISSADVTEPLARVPESVLWGIWSAAVQMTGDQALGMEVGCQFEPQSLGILGHLLANSANVGDALNRWQEFTHLIADQPLFELQPQRGIIRMEWRRRPDIDPSANRSLIEFATFSSLRLLAYLTGSGALLTTPIQRLCFRHQQPDPALLEIYRGHLPNVELACGQAANAIEPCPRRRSRLA
ncbi:MAG: AraC family transcriptional regulator ligand-binding domain-containing protein, partial [Spongiibacteraceae bacterium]